MLCRVVNGIVFALTKQQNLLYGYNHSAVFLLKTENPQLAVAPIVFMAQLRKFLTKK